MEREKIDRRAFLGVLGVGGAATLLAACGAQAPEQMTAAESDDTALADVTNLTSDQELTGIFFVPRLPYAYSALEPYIDTQTMQIHHNRHHAGYVNKLNAALQDHPDLQQQQLTQLLAQLDNVPEDIRTTIRNNGGGHLNHSLFWLTLSPHTSTPTGRLAEAITAAFGSFASFQTEMSDAAAGVFGSGWAWLVLTSEGLQIVTTPNQDSPFMNGQIPLLGIDVWEHAYYLNYQNERRNYIDAWWQVVDWDAVGRRYEAKA